MLTSPTPTVVCSQITKLVPPAGDQRQADRMSSAPPTRVTQRLLRRTARKHPEQPLEAQPEDDERQAEPEAVRDGEHHRRGRSGR